MMAISEGIGIFNVWTHNCKALTELKSNDPAYTPKGRHPPK
jgi:hypothetical protein